MSLYRTKGNFDISSNARVGSFSNKSEPFSCRPRAVNNKKSVSCPAGGRNCGQSGGRNSFPFTTFFVCLVGKYCPFLESKKNCCKNEDSSRTFFNHPAAPLETEVWPNDTLDSFESSLNSHW